MGVNVPAKWDMEYDVVIVGWGGAGTSAAITAGYDYGLYAVFLAALPALFGFWQQGATIRWYLPDLRLTVLQFAALVQVTVVALVAIPLPWIIAPAVWGVGRWRTYSEARAQAWDPMARLRRR